MGFLQKIFGSYSDREIKRIMPLQQQVLDLEEKYAAFSDEQLRDMTEKFKAQLKEGKPLDAILPDAFAVCREASWRVLSMKHFPVQILGGIILHQGIGDTIRVSLTGDPLEEIKSAKRVLKTLGLRQGGIEVVSCPTCGRTQIDLIGLANQVETMVAGFDLDIKVAVMGCVVNGPGEAKEADIGIAGGKGVGLLIKKGEIVKKVPEQQLLSVLREELLHWKDAQ